MQGCFEIPEVKSIDLGFKFGSSGPTAKLIRYYNGLGVLGNWTIRIRLDAEGTAKYLCMGTDAPEEAMRRARLARRWHQRGQSLEKIAAKLKALPPFHQPQWLQLLQQAGVGQPRVQEVAETLQHYQKPSYLTPLTPGKRRLYTRALHELARLCLAEKYSLTERQARQIPESTLGLVPFAWLESRYLDGAARKAAQGPAGTCRVTRIQASATHLSRLKSLFKPGFIDYLKQHGIPVGQDLLTIIKLTGSRVKKPIFVPLGDDQFDILLKLLREAVGSGCEWAWVLVVVFFGLAEVRNCRQARRAWLRRPGYLTLPGARGPRRIPVPPGVYSWLGCQPAFQTGAHLSGTQIQLQLQAAMRHLRRINSDKWQLHPLVELYNHGVSRQIRLQGYDEAFYLTGRKSFTNYRRFFKEKDAMGSGALTRTASLADLLRRLSP